MHARKLGCHHGHSLPCHGSSAPGVRGACGHAAEPALGAPVVRGVMPAAVDVQAVIVWAPSHARASTFRTLFLPAPPGEPPRLS